MKSRISTIVESKLGQRNSSSYQKFPFFIGKLLQNLNTLKLKGEKLDIIGYVGNKLRMITSTCNKSLQTDNR